MTIMTHRPLGHTTRTEVATVPATAYADMEPGDGAPYIVFRNVAGDVLQVLRVGDGDPMDRAALWDTIATEAARAADRARTEAVRTERAS